MEDITKTGALTYKDLQKENNADFTPEELEAFKAKYPNINLGFTPTTYLAPPSIEEMSEKEVYSPMWNPETGDYWGKSRKDNDIANPTDFYQNLQDTRAYNQSNIEKLANGIGKGIALTGTTFLDGTVGLLYGIGAMTVSGFKGEDNWWAKFWDNDVSNALQAVNNAMEEILPNYRTEAEANRAWYQNLGTVNFLADSFLKNMGFTVGAFLSGSVWTKALKGAKLLKGLTSEQLVGTTLSAVNEARIEANNNSDDWEKLQIKQVQQAYKELVEQDPDNEDFYKSAYDKQLTDIADRKAKMGLTDLVTNFALLSATNYLSWGKLYSRGWTTARNKASKLGKKATRKEAKEEAERLARQEANPMRKQSSRTDTGFDWEDLGKAEFWVNGLRTGLREGNEEMAQAFFSEYSGNMQSYDSPDAYYEALINPDAELKTKDFLTSLSEAFMGSYGNAARWEEGAVGFLTGILGMPTFGKAQNSTSNTWLGKGKVIGLSGGLFGGLSQRRQMNKEGREATEYLNKYMEKTRDGQHSLVASRAFTDAMDGWAEANNAFEYKNAEDNDTFEAISRFMKLGRLDDLKEMVNQDFENYTDEQLASVATYTTTYQKDKNGKTVPIAGWLNKDGQLLATKEEDGTININEENRNLIKQELIKKRDEFIKQINNYSESVDAVQSFGVSENMSESETNELAWLYWKIGRFSDRFSDMQKENKPAYESLLKSVTNWQTDVNKDLQDLKESKAPQAVIDRLEKFSKNLDNIHTLINLFATAKDAKEAAVISKEEKKNLDILLNEEYYNLLADKSELNQLEYENAINNLKDMGKLVDAVNSFNNRLKEFTKNPGKIAANRKKLEKKAEGKKKAREVTKKREEAAQVTPQELNSMSREQIEEKWANAGFDVEDVEAQDSEASKMSRAREKAVVEDELTKEGGIIDSLPAPPKIKEAAKRAIRDARSASEDAELSEMLDTTSEAYRNPALVGVTSENPTQQELEEATKDLEEVKKFTDKAIEQLNWEEAKETMLSMPKKVVTSEELTPEEFEEGKQVSRDGQTAAVSVDEAPSKEDIDELNKIDIKKRAEKIIDDSSTNYLPALRPALEKGLATILTDLRKMHQQGTTFNDAIGALKSKDTYKYEDLANQIPNLLSSLREFYKDLDSFKQTGGITRGEVLSQEGKTQPQAKVEEEEKKPETTNGRHPVGTRYNFTVKYKDKEVTDVVTPHIVTEDTGKFIQTTVTFSSERTTVGPSFSVKTSNSDGEAHIYLNPEDIDYEISYSGKYNLTPEQVAQNKKDLSEDITGPFIVREVFKRDWGEGVVRYFATVKTSHGNIRVSIKPSVAESIINEAMSGGANTAGTSIESSTEPATVNMNSDTMKEVEKANTAQPTNSEVYGKYKNSTTQYPITHEKGDNQKFWETVTDPVKRARYKKVTEYLEKVGAYTRVNKGLIKPGDTVHFFIDKEFNETKDEAGNTSFTIFYTDEDGNILGNVADESSATLANQGNLKALIDTIKQEYEQAGRPDKFTSQYETEIDKTFTGYVNFDTNLDTLNTKSTVETKDGTTASAPFTLGIAMEDGIGVNGEVLAIPGRTLKQRPADNIVIVSRMVKNVKAGTPIVLIDVGYTRNSKGKIVPKRIAVPILAYTFNKEFANNKNLKFTQAIEEVVKGMASKDNGTITQSVDALNDLLAFPRVEVTKKNGEKEVKSSLYIERTTDNVKNKEIVAIRATGVDGTRRTLYQGDVTNVEAIVNTLVGFPIQISRKYVNGKYKLNGEYISYNEMVGDFLVANFNPAEGVRNSFFTVVPVPTSKLDKTSSATTTTTAPTPTTTTVRPTQDVTKWLTTHREKDVWEALPAKYQDIMKGYGKAKFARVMATLKTEITLDDAFLKKTFEGKNRLTDISKPVKIFDAKKELKWLAKNLPQFTEKERLTLVEGLIKVSNDANAAYAWGQFKNGVITLSRAAARGTTYHEAFHAVFDTLLSDSEKEALYKEAEEIYKTNDRLTLEENLAESFREYVQFRETPKGKIVRFFEKIKHLIDKIRNKPQSIDSLFYRINNGEFARSAQSDLVNYNELIRMNRIERLKYNNLDNESKEYLEESNIDEKTYDKMTLEEKENLLYCKI